MVGDVCLAEEVVLGATRCDDLTLSDLSAVKLVEAIDSDRLLEVDAILAVEATGLELGLALDGDTQRLVGSKPSVEGGEGVQVGDVDVLGDVDLLVLLAAGLGEVEGDEGGVRLQVLEVHDALEGVDLGADFAVGGDGRVDRQREGSLGRLQHGHALDLQVGVVNLVLRDLGHRDEDSAREV